jgi:hypothetical protein
MITMSLDKMHIAPGKFFPDFIGFLRVVKKP